MRSISFVVVRHHRATANFYTLRSASYDGRCLNQSTHLPFLYTCNAHRLPPEPLSLHVYSIVQPDILAAVFNTPFLIPTTSSQHRLQVIRHLERRLSLRLDFIDRHTLSNFDQCQTVCEIHIKDTLSTVVSITKPRLTDTLVHLQAP